MLCLIFNSIILFSLLSSLSDRTAFMQQMPAGFQMMQGGMMPPQMQMMFSNAGNPMLSMMPPRFR